jgi:hypothetical protein
MAGRFSSCRAAGRPPATGAWERLGSAMAVKTGGRKKSRGSEVESQERPEIAPPRERGRRRTLEGSGAMPFHVHITHVDPNRRMTGDTVAVDKDKSWIEENIVRPRAAGAPCGAVPRRGGRRL